MNKTNQNSGFLLINKPTGMTSHDVIDELRKITQIKRIGHAGTLDPFAVGLLIVGVGREATRRLNRFLKLDKEYIATLRLGAVSDTYDRDGKKQETRNNNQKNHNNQSSIIKQKIEKVLQHFTGEIEQIPPMYSAKKIKGKKLYELVRKGIEIKRKPQKVVIYEIQLLTTNDLQITANKKSEASSNQLPVITISVHCSSGTYIRSLAHDIGKALNCGAYLEELKRTKIGEYKIEDAVKLKDLTPNNWQKSLMFKIDILICL